jgi:predicted nucleic acid-binding protein
VTPVVVDASVGIKWALPEPNSDAARRLLDGERALLVPDLFFAEIANTMWKRVARRDMTAVEARAALRSFDTRSLGVHPSRSLMHLALELAVRSAQTAYDCLYLALAVIQDCPLVTADSRLYAALEPSPLGGHLLWVADAR